ncbi:MAG: hypothetical protein GXY42_03010 [Desulfovibrionales bacterium]|nr:hypothetical protein [Desulfovibrionales bacterium]
MRKTVVSPDAPPAVGPYSQAVISNGFVFTSGQVPLHPETKQLSTDITDATRQCFANLKAIVEAAGAGMDTVVKVTIFIIDMGQFPAINEVYKTIFSEPYPSRSCVAVSALPLGAMIEIELIAALK